MKKAFVGILLMVVGILMIIPTIIKHIEIRQDCLGYLKQAADASTIGRCRERLGRAIEYIETRGLTYGYTSVLYKTESDNVGFWYKNLKDCQQILSENDNAKSLTQSNILMRVRECLTDIGEEGTTLTIPKGLCYFPNNTFWAFYRLLIVLFILLGVFLIYRSDEDYSW